MNRSLTIPALAVALAFSAGYAARGVGGTAPAGDGGQVATGASGSTAAGRGGEREEALRKIADRGRTGSTGQVFKPPFAPGQAKTWLESFGQTNSGDDVARIQFCQQCGRLDAKSAEELAMACLETAWLIDGKDSVTLGKFKDSNLPGEWMGPVLMRLAELNPVRALALMKHSGDQSMPDSVLRAVFDTVARQDPRLAQAALAGLAEEDRNAALEALTTRWSKTDPVAVLAMLDGMTDVEDMRGVCLEAMVQSDPELALSTALSDATGRHEMGSLRALVGADPEMRQRIADWVADYGGPDPAGIRSGALEAITSEDPGMGKALYSRMASTMTAEEQVKAADQITAVLANTLGGDVKGWIAGLADGPGKQAALATALRQAIDNSAITRNNIDAVLNDPNRASGRTNTDFIDPITGQEFPGVPAGTANIITGGFRSWTDPSAGSWLEQMEPSAQKDALTRQLISKLQTNDPGQAQRLLDAMPAGEAKDSLIRENQLRIELEDLRGKAEPVIITEGRIDMPVFRRGTRSLLGP